MLATEVGSVRLFYAHYALESACLHDLAVGDPVPVFGFSKLLLVISLDLTTYRIKEEVSNSRCWGPTAKL